MANYLDKILRHAEGRLIRRPNTKPSDILALYQQFLRMEQHRLRLKHKADASGKEICRGRAQLIDVVLQHIHEGATGFCKEKHKVIKPPRFAVLAVGGYGRGELNPFSDVDVMFLYEQSGKQRHPYIEDVIQQILYMLWDVGFKVGHASRSISESISHANEDNQSKTALIESRCLAGDESLFAEFQLELNKKCVTPYVEAYLKYRILDQRERHAKYGNTVFLQEPNIKQGCGGLRDYQNLCWMTYFKWGIRTTLEMQERGWLTATERKQLEKAYDFLMRVRNELHFRSERANDVINLNIQGRIADAFNYPQKTMLRRIEVFMRDYYTHARNIFVITETLAQRLAFPVEKTGKRYFTFLARMQKKVEHFDGFTLKEGVLFSESPLVFKEDPLRLLKVFLYTQQRQAELSPELKSQIRASLGLVNRAFIYSKGSRETFRAILENKGQVGKILRSMHELDFLGKFMPEFCAITCLVQHEFFHRYTADEHTLQCVEKLDQVIDATETPFSRYSDVFHDLEQPFILYLALLVHDTGRADNSRNHSDVSAKNAMHLARRFHLSPTEKSSLVLLVDHHLTMGDFCRKRDLHDPTVIEEFARIVRDEQILYALHLLSFADSQAVGGLSGLDWKDMLQRQLFDRTRDKLTGAPERSKIDEARIELRERVMKLMRNPGQERIDELDTHFSLLSGRYVYTRSPEDVLRDLALVKTFVQRQIDEENPLFPLCAWQHYPDQGHSMVTVCTWDRQNLFEKISGAMTLAELNILSAAIYTRPDNVVIDIFRVCTTRFESVSDQRDISLMEGTLVRALTDEDFILSARIREMKTKQPLPEPLPERFPQKLIIDNDASSTYTMIEIQTADRLGLLFDVLQVLSELNFNIGLAKIATEKGAALDTLYVVDKSGQKIVDESMLSEIRSRLKQVLTHGEIIEAS